MPKIRYRCGQCEARGVRLWRSLSGEPVQRIMCLLCGEKDQGQAVGGDRRIGQLVPALPTAQPDSNDELPEDHTYWSRGTAPPNVLRWWEERPTRISN